MDTTVAVSASPVRVGAPLVVEVHFTGPEPVDEVVFTLVGSVELGGAQEVFDAAEVCVLAPRFEAGRLEARIPTDGLAPTCVGELARVAYLLQVELRSDTAPLEAHREVVLLPPVRPGQVARPVHLVAGEFELTLDADVLVPGQLAEGELALSSRKGNVEVSLVGRAGDREAVRQVVAGWREDEGGRPFSFRVPDIAPSLAVGAVVLAWTLEVSIGLAESTITAGTEVTVVRAEECAAVARARPRVAPPAVRALFAQIAAELGFASAGDGMRGAVAGVDVSLRREPRGGRYLLVAELGFAPLHLDLSITPARDGDEGEWNDDHYVSARDRNQAYEFLGTLGDALTAVWFDEMSDTRARVRRAVGALGATRLRDFAARIIRLARALGDGRPPVPPPTAMRAAVASWHELAAVLGGVLETGRMAVTGTHQGLPAAVRTCFTHGVPVATELSVTPPLVPAEIPQEVANLAEEVGGEGLDLAIGPLTIALTAPGAAISAAPLVEHLAWLVRLAGMLAGGSAPLT